ncbi:hypothetical protein [Erysipelothrix aquatica]|uniref:hypothetical protein n=1 Tax=Erysipelothrix aquatica TaxID=2683714 RepID=UPI00135862F4|nr:hypothetical protein [Erysipelothrix aquatica]
MINERIKKLEIDLENLNPKLVEFNKVVESEQLKLSEAMNNRNLVKNQVDVLNEEIMFWKTVQEKVSKLGIQLMTVDVDTDIEE